MFSYEVPLSACSSEAGEMARGGSGREEAAGITTDEIIRRVFTSRVARRATLPRPAIATRPDKAAFFLVDGNTARVALDILMCDRACIFFWSSVELSTLETCEVSLR